MVKPVSSALNPMSGPQFCQNPGDVDAVVGTSLTLTHICPRESRIETSELAATDMEQSPRARSADDAGPVIICEPTTSGLPCCAGTSPPSVDTRTRPVIRVSSPAAAPCGNCVAQSQSSDCAATGPAAANVATAKIKIVFIGSNTPGFTPQPSCRLKRAMPSCCET